MTAIQPPATPSEPGATPATEIVALLFAMLDTIVECQQAVLQDEGETAILLGRVARHMLLANQTLAAASAAQWTSTLTAILELVLQSPEEPITGRALIAQFSGLRIAACTGSCVSEPDDALANWFFQLSLKLNEIHPTAGQMLRYRFAGFDRRSIGERLGLPPRLVQRVLDALRSFPSAGGESRGAA